jgi:hypothetical protein
MKCSVCGKPGGSCYATVLCDRHVVEANRVRDQRGPGAPWAEVVAFIAEWSRKERAKNPETEATG